MPRVDFYTAPHDEQRSMLFEIAHKASTINFKDTLAVKGLMQQIENMIKELRDHAESEETWAHPFILSKFDKEVLQFEEDHQAQEAVLDEVEENVRSLQTGSMDSQDLGQKMYKSLCKFIGRYLTHLEKEEAILPLLWEAFTDAELWAVKVVYCTIKKPAEAEKLLTMLSADLNAQDLDILFTKIKDVHPPQDYEKVMALYESLSPFRQNISIART
ncbi:hemerythrin domain-containing protein [Candidatus Nucleicultrix amoebiphila]|jgi:hemerythrin-like domain-containing protein|uniref:Hemerythrin-like domain-containing protein n=1 Tax=Candidatus Nucleicultrix amoebiphila FS5 TaxID=1414854 RepID=A0A1W6N5E1_9PROT|nr:hemerythrin domain-containing protein [Candidatus Nucleicultrix amoebiphila]ARN84969.1 hypothetical protein GQ61_06355 [Candidatus Nucleicultrix amoebiphila FS5]